MRDAWCNVRNLGFNRLDNIMQRRKQKTIVGAILFLITTCSFSASSLAQTLPPPEGALLGIDNSGSQLTKRAANTQNTVPVSKYYDAKGQTTLIQQAAEQNTLGVIANTDDLLLQGSELGQYNSTYAGLKKFW